MIHYFHLVGVAQMIFCIFYLAAKVFVATCAAMLAMRLCGFWRCCHRIAWLLQDIRDLLRVWTPR
jgi:hypothetical protein